MSTRTLTPADVRQLGRENSVSDLSSAANAGLARLALMRRPDSLQGQVVRRVFQLEAWLRAIESTGVNRQRRPRPLSLVEHLVIGEHGLFPEHRIAALESNANYRTLCAAHQTALNRRRAERLREAAVCAERQREADALDLDGVAA